MFPRLRFSLPLRLLSGRCRLRSGGRRLLGTPSCLLSGPCLLQRPCIGIPGGREEVPLPGAAVSQLCKELVDPVHDPLSQSRFLSGQLQNFLFTGEQVMLYVLCYNLLVNFLLTS